MDFHWKVENMNMTGGNAEEYAKFCKMMGLNPGQGGSPAGVTNGGQQQIQAGNSNQPQKHDTNKKQ